MGLGCPMWSCTPSSCTRTAALRHRRCAPTQTGRGSRCDRPIEQGREQQPDSVRGLLRNDPVAQQLELLVTGQPRHVGDVTGAQPHHPLDEPRRQLPPAAFA